MNKEKIYEEATRKELGTNPNGTRMEVVYTAMDEYAKQKAIDFAKWLSDNDYKPFKKMGEDHWLQGGMSISARIRDLYDKFVITSY